MDLIKEPYHLFSEPIRYINVMIDDIQNAKDYIYIETYRIGNDTIGIKFRDLLTKKAKAGVEVKILIDAWGGSGVNNNFFDALKKYGGEVRFFEKIKYNSDIFTRSHRRNHRKMLIIDDEITYIGSSNITEYNLNWRESVLRITGPMTLAFKKIFRQDFSIYNTYVFVKANYLRLIRFNQFEIVRDMPSISKQRIMKKYIQMIRKAEKTVTILTPYFLPGFNLRKALIDASLRGVNVKVIIPKRSDVGLVDILRNKYLGQLHLDGVEFLLYLPHNLHAKVMLIDDKYFSLGSPNFDYRSFRYMYEIVLIGSEYLIVDQLKEYVTNTIENTEMFNFEHWKRRSLINKIFEYILLPFRHLL
ncbi:MAG: phosphatidylserine/phosphatidylglycerophosphate/cardiolipin synthase family protein [Bacteroidetes bacterium]|jgi:cardiolipin synthase A/B|nr:phosphatidylserine/phosphatidylglycerophosphate/cardiolipin synthase family protein [Bacteroidota bacterium]